MSAEELFKAYLGQSCNVSAVNHGDMHCDVDKDSGSSHHDTHNDMG